MARDPDEAVYLLGGAAVVAGPGRRWGVVHLAPAEGACSVDPLGCGYCIGVPCQQPARPPVCQRCGHRHPAADDSCAGHVWDDSCPYDAGADCTGVGLRKLT